MYLFNYKDIYSREYEILNKLAESYGLIIEPLMVGGYINSSIKMFYSKYPNRFSILSEFPGNCTALVLHRIEDHLDKEEKLNFSIEACLLLKYGLLFVTGVSSSFYDYLTYDEFKFEPVIKDIYNKHTGNNNFFMVKYL